MKSLIIHNLDLNDKPFCFERDVIYSYSDLRREIIKISQFFINNNYYRVLIDLNQGFYAYAVVLAAYLSGTIFCCINEAWPQKRKDYIIERFEPDIILNSSDPYAHKCINYFNIPYSCKTIDQCVRCSDIAYVLFTSGSSGEPKGVLIKSASLEELIVWAINEFDLKETDVFGQYSPLFFDMSMFDIFGVASRGCSIVPFATLADKLRPANLIERFKITFWNSVPQFLSILKASKALQINKLQSLRTIKFGGDKIFDAQLKELFDILPNVKIILTYGPTETTIFCTTVTLNKNTYNKNAFQGLMTLGRPVPQCKILLNNCEDGVGEIVVYGSNVALGYIGLADDAFIKDGDYNIAYRTGDYARLIDNNLYFCGRKDKQVKINGTRVHLSEIEKILVDIGIDQFVVFAHKGLIYIAYSGCNLTETCIQNKIQQWIAKNLCPAKIKYYSYLPLLDNGKIDQVKIKRDFITGA